MKYLRKWFRTRYRAVPTMYGYSSQYRPWWWPWYIEFSYNRTSLEIARRECLERMNSSVEITKETK